MANYTKEHRVKFATSNISPEVEIDPRDIIVAIKTEAAFVGVTLAANFSFDDGVSTLFATGTVDLTGGASGTVDGITVDSIEIMSSAVSFNSTLTQTATDVAANITANTSSPDYDASANGTVITIVAVTTDEGVNGFDVTSAATTITTTDVDMSGGGPLYNAVYALDGTQACIITDSSVADGRAYSLDSVEWDVTNKFKLVSSSAIEVGVVTIVTKTRK